MLAARDGVISQSRCEEAQLWICREYDVVGADFGGVLGVAGSRGIYDTDVYGSEELC